MSEEAWYVLGEGASAALGPFSPDLIVRGIVAGKIPSTSKVCRVGSEEWLPVDAVPAFGDAFLETVGGAASVAGPPLAPASAGAGNIADEVAKGVIRAQQQVKTQEAIVRGRRNNKIAAVVVVGLAALGVLALAAPVAKIAAEDWLWRHRRREQAAMMNTPPNESGKRAAAMLKLVEAYEHGDVEGATKLVDPALLAMEARADECTFINLAGERSASACRDQFARNYEYYKRGGSIPECPGTFDASECTCRGPGRAAKVRPFAETTMHRFLKQVFDGRRCSFEEGAELTLKEGRLERVVVAGGSSDRPVVRSFGVNSCGEATEGKFGIVAYRCEGIKIPIGLIFHEFDGVWRLIDRDDRTAAILLL